MVERQDDECAPALVNVHKSRSLLHIRRVVAVCQHDTLGVGCCTACISNCRNIIVHKRLPHREKLLESVSLQEPIAHREYLVNVYLAILKLADIAKDNDFLHLSEFLLYGTYLLELIVRHKNILHIAVYKTEQKVIALLKLY